MHSYNWTNNPNQVVIIFSLKLLCWYAKITCSYAHNLLSSLISTLKIFNRVLRHLRSQLIWVTIIPSLVMLDFQWDKMVIDMFQHFISIIRVRALIMDFFFPYVCNEHAMGDNNEPIKLNLYVPFCKCWFVLIEGFYSLGIISAEAKNSVDYIVTR